MADELNANGTLPTLGPLIKDYDPAPINRYPSEKNILAQQNGHKRDHQSDL